MDNQITQQPMGQTPAGEENKPSFTIHNIIALIFIAMILISWFLPVEKYGRGTQISDLMVWPMIIMGVVAGISFLVRVIKLTRKARPILRFFGILVGLGGGVFIFIIGFISGVISGFRAHPT